jgi:hypothetical protein
MHLVHLSFATLRACRGLLLYQLKHAQEIRTGNYDVGGHAPRQAQSRRVCDAACGQDFVPDRVHEREERGARLPGSDVLLSLFPHKDVALD